MSCVRGLLVLLNFLTEVYYIYRPIWDFSLGIFIKRFAQIGGSLLESTPTLWHMKTISPNTRRERHRVPQPGILGPAGTARLESAGSGFRECCLGPAAPPTLTTTGGTMPSFLERWNDAGLEVDMGWDPSAYALTQRERISNLALMASHAAEVPRRLGQDATPEELRVDKLISRRVYTRAMSSLINWGTQEVDQGQSAAELEELHRAGAQVIWSKWWEEYRAQMEQELRLVATTALKTGHLKAGNSFCNRLLNELNIMGQLFEAS